MDQALVVGVVAVAGDITAVAVAVITVHRQARADAERLHAENVESDRRVRRDAYRRLLHAVSALDAMTKRYVEPPTTETFEAWLHEFRAAEIEAALVESRGVRSAAAPLGRAYGELASSVEARVQSGIPLADALGESYGTAGDEIQTRAMRLLDAMRADLSFLPPEP